jgi:hypothetical protein
MNRGTTVKPHAQPAVIEPHRQHSRIFNVQDFHHMAITAGFVHE